MPSGSRIIKLLNYCTRPSPQLWEAGPGDEAKPVTADSQAHHLQTSGGSSLRCLGGHNLFIL